VVGGVDVGSVFGGLGVRKFWVAERTLLASTTVLRLKTARGVEQGVKLLQAGCQVSALALEMTEDALCDTSMYARRWASEQRASERSLRLSHTDSASSHHHALRRRLRRPKGMEALAAFKRKEKERAAQ